MRDKKDVSIPSGDYATRVCPRCGETLFADMGVCYGCLYDFTREEGPVSDAPQLPDPASSRDGGWDLGLPPAEYEWNEDDTFDMTGCTKLPGGVRGVTMLWIRTSSLDVCVPVPATGLIVGRDPSSDVVLHSRAVSRGHLRIVPRPGGVVVENLGATNPAVFQGRDVDDAVEVKVGETVSLCGSLITVVGSEG